MPEYAVPEPLESHAWWRRVIAVYTKEGPLMNHQTTPQNPAKTTAGRPKAKGATQTSSRSTMASAPPPGTVHDQHSNVGKNAGSKTAH